GSWGGYVKSGIYSELNSYRMHTLHVYDLLEEEAKSVQKHHENVANDMDQDEALEYLEFMSDDYWELADTLPSIQRKSELISIYTILENGLNQICSIYESNIDNPVKVSDLASHGIIDKSRKYLEKVARVSFPEDSDEWKEIKTIQTIRNAFVHRNGLIKEGNQEVINYINDTQYLSLKDGQKVVIDEQFTLHCLTLFKEFFIKLFEVIETVE
ncbi:hypothetical protein AB4178_25820, partial [Vibrio splendidus]